MKINFDDTSYIQISRSPTDKIQVVLSARDNKNPYNSIINSAEISLNQFIEIIKEILPNLK